MAITFDDTTIKHSLYTWKVPFQCTERACVIFFRFRNSLQKMYYVTKSVASFKDQREYLLHYAVVIMQNANQMLATMNALQPFLNENWFDW